MGRETCRDVWVGSGDLPGGSGRARGPSGNSGTVVDRVTCGEIRDGSRDPREGLGRIGGHTQRFLMGGMTLGEFRDWSGDPKVSPGWVG